jgi:hypothetical protein
MDRCEAGQRGISLEIMFLRLLKSNDIVRVDGE